MSIRNCESLDTNIFLRAILEDNAEQSNKAKRLLDDKNRHFHVADAAIIEMVFVLERCYELPREYVVKSVNSIMTEPNINCNRTLFNSALPFYLSHPKLSFTDCCLASYAGINEAVPLWTFDKKLALQSDVAKEL